MQMIIDSDIGYVRRWLDRTQTSVECLAVQYEQLSGEIDRLQKDERELFGELVKMEQLSNWDKVETWGNVFKCVDGWFDFIRLDRDKLKYTEDDYAVVIIADDSIYGCKDIIPLPDSEIVFLGEYMGAV